MAKSEPLLITVDMGNLMRKNLYGMKPLSYHGNYTQAIKGTLGKLQELERMFKPSHIALCFDSKGPNWRHKYYPEYKANREAAKKAPKAPPVSEESFHWQSKVMFKLFTAMGYCILKDKKYEADDFMGSSAHQFVEYYPEGLVKMWSGDKDFAALVTSQIHHLYPLPWVAGGGPTHLVLDKKGVLKKFGVKPRQMVDLLAMMGDKVDNIPGVVGIGPTYATRLLQEWGSLDGVRKNIKKLSPAHRTAIQKCKKLDLWVKMVTIKCDIEVPIKKMKLSRREPNLSAVKDIYKLLGFKEELARLSNKKLF